MKKKACSVCLTNCLRIHGNEDEDDTGSPDCSRGAKEEDAAPTRSPCFLKKMIESTMTSTMQLPSSFVKAHGKSLGVSVTLEGPSGERWKVELGGSVQKFTSCLRLGWRKFVSDHVLQIGDQLSFNLTAKSYFQVQVYDESGCEKVSALDATNSPTTPLEAKTKKDESDSFGAFQSTPASRLLGRKHTKRSPLDAAEKSAKKPLIDLESSGSEAGSIGGDVGGKETKKLVKAEKAEKSQDQTPHKPNTEKGELLPERKLINGHVISSRRPVTEAEKQQCLEAARTLKVNSPNILMVMTKAYVYRGFWLSLAKKFSRDWMPSETREVTLVNKGGQKWQVRWLNKDNGSQMGLSAGWRRFALDHRLEEFDVCVFELVDQANFVLLVHIFRVISGESEEDMAVYCPSPVKTRKSPGKKLKPSQDFYQDTEDQDFSSFHRQSLENASGPSSGKKRLKRNESSTLVVEGVELGHKGELSPVNLLPKQGEENLSTKSHKRRPASRTSNTDDVGHNDSKQNYVIDGSLEYNIDHHAKKKKSSPEAPISPDLEIVPGNEDGKEEGGPSDGRTPLQPSTAVTSPRKTNHATRSADLVKLAKEILARNSPKPGSPPSPSAQVDENMGLQVEQEAQAMIPYQAREEHSNMAESSIPVRDHATPVPSDDGVKKDARQLYNVARIVRGRSGANEVGFLVELEGLSEGDVIKNSTRDENTGLWWISSNQFDWGMDKCYIELLR